MGLNGSSQLVICCASYAAYAPRRVGGEVFATIRIASFQRSLPKASLTTPSQKSGWRLTRAGRPKSGGVVRMAKCGSGVNDMQSGWARCNEHRGMSKIYVNQGVIDSLRLVLD